MRPLQKYPPYGKQSEQSAVIESEKDGVKYVRSADGKLHCLVNGSLNGTLSPVGTKGKLAYITSPSFGLHFFQADIETK
jgi:hypothetical protein